MNTLKISIYYCHIFIQLQEQLLESFSHILLHESMRLREVKRFATKSKSVDVHAESLQLCPTLSARLLCLWNIPGKNTGVSCPFLLQGIVPTQGSNPYLSRLLY